MRERHVNPNFQSKATLSESEKDAVIHRRWGIECACIRLTQCKLLEPIEFVGQGSIKQAADGRIVLHMYSNLDIGPTLLTLSEILGVNLRSGDLYPNAMYFNCKATDLYGYEWHAERLLLELDIAAALGKCVIDCDVNELTRYGESQEEGWRVELVTTQKPKFPMHLYRDTQSSVANEVIGGRTELCMLSSKNDLFEIDIEEKDSATYVRLRDSEKSRSSQFLSRMQEAIDFSAGAELEYVVQTTLHDKRSRVTIRSCGKTGINQFYSVVPLRNPQNAADFSSLMYQYFAYIHAFDNIENLHPIARVVRQIHRSSDWVVEMEILSLATAIEALLKSEFKDYATSNGELSVTVKTAIALLNSGMPDSSVKSRLIGALNSCLHTSAIDLLSGAAERHQLRPDLVKLWKITRNTAAHPVAHRSSDVASSFPRVNSLRTLFHELILARIEYRGPYFDYSRAGFPLIKPV